VGIQRRLWHRGQWPAGSAGLVTRGTRQREQMRSGRTVKEVAAGSWGGSTGVGGAGAGCWFGSGGGVDAIQIRLPQRGQRAVVSPGLKATFTKHREQTFTLDMDPPSTRVPVWQVSLLTCAESSGVMRSSYGQGKRKHDQQVQVARRSPGRTVRRFPCIGCSNGTAHGAPQSRMTAFAAKVRGRYRTAIANARQYRTPSGTDPRIADFKYPSNSPLT